MGTTQHRRMNCGGLILLALCGFSGNAAAQGRPPSGEELHSMYCVETLRAEITLQNHLISASSEAAGTAEAAQRAQWLDTSAELLQRLEKLQGSLRRLQAYMLPRISSIDALALASVIRQASSLQSADADSLLSHVRDCEDPVWLRGASE